MSATRVASRRSAQDDAVPMAPQSTPQVQGGGDYSPFVWTQLGDIQKTLGGLESSVAQLSDSLDKVNATLERVQERLDAKIEKTQSGIGEKLDKAHTKIDERLDKMESKLSGVTHKMYAAGVVLMIVVGIGGFVVNKAWDLMAKAVFERPAQIQPAPSATAPATKKP